MPNVRIPDPSEEDDLVSYARKLDGQWGLAYADGTAFPFSESRARETIRAALNRDQSWIGVIGEPGKIEASICLYVAQPFYSDQDYLAELWTNVLPEYRHTDNAKALLAFAKKFARAIDLPLVVGVLSRERTEAKCRLFERALGQQSQGRFYVYHHQNDAGDRA